MNSNDICGSNVRSTYIRCCQSSSIFVPHHLVFWRARSALYNVKIGSEGSESIPIMYVKSRSRLRTLYILCQKVVLMVFFCGVNPHYGQGGGKAHFTVHTCARHIYHQQNASCSHTGTRWTSNIIIIDLSTCCLRHCFSCVGGDAIQNEIQIAKPYAPQ